MFNSPNIKKEHKMLFHRQNRQKSCFFFFSFSKGEVVDGVRDGEMGTKRKKRDKTTREEK